MLVSNEVIEGRLAVKYRPIGALLPHARNARTHSEAQIAQIAASIREFGWTNPILVDGANGVIAGHGRLLAAKALGLAEVPVIELAGMTEAQKRAYVIADNKLALNAGWSEELLRLELGELKELGADLGLIGFDGDELKVLFAPAVSAGLTDPDAVPEVPVEPVTRPGDVWLLGHHRLLCGDATVASDVERVLGGLVPQLMVTDPPYGVDYDPTWRHAAGLNTSKRVGRVENDQRADWRQAWMLFPGAVVYVWHGALHAMTVADSLMACGFEIRSQIIWAKERLVIGRGHYHWQHEPCWYAVRQGRTATWTGDRTQTTLWTISSRHQDTDTVHGTQKPVECMRRPIENNSTPGDAVYDPFLGSGTTLIAAEMTRRICCGLEINPSYCDVVVQRWQAFTGRTARLDGGETIVEMAAARNWEAKPLRVSNTDTSKSSGAGATPSSGTMAARATRATA